MSPNLRYGGVSSRGCGVTTTVDDRDRNKPVTRCEKGVLRFGSRSMKVKVGHNAFIDRVETANQLVGGDGERNALELDRAIHPHRFDRVYPTKYGLDSVVKRWLAALLTHVGRDTNVGMCHELGGVHVYELPAMDGVEGALVATELIPEAGCELTAAELLTGTANAVVFEETNVDTAVNVYKSIMNLVPLGRGIVLPAALVDTTDGLMALEASFRDKSLAKEIVMTAAGALAWTETPPSMGLAPNFVDWIGSAPAITYDIVESLSVFDKNLSEVERCQAVVDHFLCMLTISGYSVLRDDILHAALQCSTEKVYTYRGPPDEISWTFAKTDGDLRLRSVKAVGVTVGAEGFRNMLTTSASSTPNSVDFAAGSFPSTESMDLALTVTLGARRARTMRGFGSALVCLKNEAFTHQELTSRLQSDRLLPGVVVRQSGGAWENVKHEATFSGIQEVAWLKEFDEVRWRWAIFSLLVFGLWTVVALSSIPILLAVYVQSEFHSAELYDRYYSVADVPVSVRSQVVASSLLIMGEVSVSLFGEVLGRLSAFSCFATVVGMYYVSGTRTVSRRAAKRGKTFAEVMQRDGSLKYVLSGARDSGFRCGDGDPPNLSWIGAQRPDLVSYNPEVSCQHTVMPCVGRLTSWHPVG